MRKHIVFTTAALLMLGASVTSCSDFLSEYSQDMVVAKEVTHFDEVLLGDVYIHSSIMSYGVSPSAVGGFLNILDDDVNTGKGSSLTNQTSRAWSNAVQPCFGYFAWQLEVGMNYTGTSNVGDNVMWSDLYRRINIVNVILDEIVDLPHETEEDDATYWRVQGEAHFLRGYFYFLLANLYGNMYTDATCATDLCVPLKLTAYVEHDPDKDTQFQRATVKEVYDQIIFDLKKADEYLTKSPQVYEHMLYRASKEAADLMLSRVYLYMQNWEEAEKWADEVIGSRNVSLARLSSLGKGKKFLTEESTEIIFSQGSNFLASDEIMTGMAGDFCVAKELYDLYDLENDKRAETFFEVETSTDSIALANKYGHSSTRMKVSDVFTLRVAEAYLNKAEACAMQSGKEQVACDMLNDLRTERILDYVSQTYTGEELVNEIRNERRKELCFEGQRWFDLRRYAVNKNYPYKREITHVLNVAGDNVDYLFTRLYVLKKDDYAYTFSIPKDVIEFDKVPMPDNPREEREPIEVEDDGGDVEIGE